MPSHKRQPCRTHVVPAGQRWHFQLTPAPGATGKHSCYAHHVPHPTHHPPPCTWEAHQACPVPLAAGQHSISATYLAFSMPCLSDSRPPLPGRCKPQPAPPECQRRTPQPAPTRHSAYSTLGHEICGCKHMEKTGNSVPSLQHYQCKQHYRGLPITHPTKPMRTGAHAKKASLPTHHGQRLCPWLHTVAHLHTVLCHCCKSMMQMSQNCRCPLHTYQRKH